MAKSIAVFGSFIADVTARAPRFPKPGENVMGTSMVIGPGGKGSNQAVAAFKAGAEVRFIGKIGKDGFGQVARDYYASIGMDVSGLMEDEEAATGSALISVNEATGENTIIVVVGANRAFSPEDIEQAKERAAGADILLMQMETPLSANLEMLKFAKERGMTTILNPAPAQPLPPEVYRYVDIVTPNEFEAAALTGMKVPEGNEEAVKAAAAKLLALGARQVILTLGAAGAYAHDGRQGRFLPALSVRAVDTTGAGDAFTGGFSAALSFGMGFFEAAAYGVAVSGLCVTKEGTALSMPGKEETEPVFEAYMKSLGTAK